MKALVLRELKTIFCSSAGAFFALVFLSVTGAMLWAFSGSYNFIDGGYSDMSRFFDIAPILFIILVPALTMRLFSDEKRNNTLDILITRPVSSFEIYLSKFAAIFIFVLFTLLSTIIYVYSLYQLANPIGNIDLNFIVSSYVSLILLIFVFISIGLFSSALTKNQAVAFIISVFLIAFAFYGFDLLTGLFPLGKMQSIISSLGLSYHYKLMQRGVIQLGDLITIANYFILFVLFTLYFINKIKSKLYIIILILMSIINGLFFMIPNARFDFTSDKRYTLSDYTVNLLKSLDKKETLSIDVYLDGDLNYGFRRLQNATNDLLSDYNRYANGDIVIKIINPYQLNEGKVDIYESMQSKGMSGIVLNEINREGKVSRKIIYPYAQINNGKDTLTVPLLKNVAGNTAEENLNASIESLEFEFTDAIRLLNQKEEKSVAFIEGHEELSRTYVYDAEELLSKYYSVNRGEIGNQLNILDDFDAVIIAGPLTKYNDAEKYIIDQYIMSGGKVLWLIDGVYYSHQNLTDIGQSATMKNDINLDDILFSYGVRINPELIQDKQCVSTYLISDRNHQVSSLQPNYYQPLLIPSPNHPVTKDIWDVKAGYASSIDIVNNSPDIEKNILLTSSANTHLLKVPDIIDFDIEKIQDLPNYFTQSYIPVAVSMEGNFKSVYENRPIPDEVNVGNNETINLSKATKMIVVSSSDIISNEIEGEGENSQVLPMGYDRVSGHQFGNRDFLINAVTWLTNDDELMVLRTRKQKMYILNKKSAYENRDKYAILNIGLPILFMFVVMGTTYMYRKKKYSK